MMINKKFSRTLAGNTGKGSDHAWGGNYFIAGGEVQGKQILGEFPKNLSDDGPLVFAPGIVIPTLPWYVKTMNEEVFLEVALFQPLIINNAIPFPQGLNLERNSPVDWNHQ